MNFKKDLTQRKFITFLFKPKQVFSSFREDPSVITPIFIIIAFMTFSTIYPTLLKMESIKAIATTTIMATALPILLTTIYLFLIYFFMKNKQSFLHLLSIVLHAWLSITYFSFIIQVFSPLIGMGDFLSLSVSFIKSIIFFVYLGIGIKWSISGTNKQFLIAFISYILLAILATIALIFLVVWMIVTMMNDLMNFFCSFFGCS